MVTIHIYFQDVALGAHVLGSGFDIDYDAGQDEDGHEARCDRGDEYPHESPVLSGEDVLEVAIGGGERSGHLCDGVGLGGCGCVELLDGVLEVVK